MPRLRSPLRRKLLFATLAPLTVAILLSWMIGATLVTDRIFKQAQAKVVSDLNSARKVYLDEIDHLTGVVKVAGLQTESGGTLQGGRAGRFEGMLGQLLSSERLSFLTVVDTAGVVRYRAANRPVRGDSLAADPLVARALSGIPCGGSQVYERRRLARENPLLVAADPIRIMATPHARTDADGREERGLLLVAAAPLRSSNGHVVGALLTGQLLNGDTKLVDTITKIVYEREQRGAATIFLDDVRIATTLQDASSERAVGSLMSQAVAAVVLKQHKPWSERAFVLNDWYLSAYEPIRDPHGMTVGALYVGMPERPFLNVRTNINLIFSAVLAFVGLIGIVLAVWISSRLARPVRALADGARRMASGERIAPIVVTSHDEIGLLADEFNAMSREVSTLNSTLEQKVLERTVQLQEKSQQLLSAQSELARAERLSGLGLLAAGVAHEINNPLAVIRGNAELLQEIIPDGQEGAEEVGEIMAESGRIERIVANLRVFSRSGLKRVSCFSVSDLLDSILDQIGHQLSLELYRIDRNYGGQDVEISGDSDQLRQVFTNLILNGLQAMPEGGRLTLELQLQSADERLLVAVTDSGPGIVAEHLEKLFTPFFSTKARGTGLGLAVSYGIIKDHGGEITVQSEPGKGSRFTVTLPLAQA
jgi:two-component system NtrC family sensor kinase